MEELIPAMAGPLLDPITEMERVLEQSAVKWPTHIICQPAFAEEYERLLRDTQAAIQVPAEMLK